MKIYTDGSYNIGKNIGGWAAVVVQQNEVIETLRGFQEITTVNKLELTAVLESLKYNYPTTIYTDCLYVVKGYNYWMHDWNKRNWTKTNKKPIKHADIWKKVLSLHHPLKKVEHIKGHNGHKYNEMADKLAKNYKHISFISFADSVLIKSNWTTGHVDSDIEYNNDNRKRVRSCVCGFFCANFCAA